MKAYAIRQKSTGAFIPHRPRRKFGRGYSKRYTGAKPEKDCIPRLFKKRHHAKSALDWWLAGEWSIMRYGGYETPPDYGLDSIKQLNRNPDDMEIVEVEIRVKG